MGDKSEELLEPEEKGSFKAKVILGLVVLAVIGMGWLFGVYIASAWWSRRIGDIADGRLWFSGFLGFVFGLFCTFLPLIALRFAWRMRHGTKRALSLLFLGIVIAAPNLILLGIATGDSNTAHNAERSLGTDAPWFSSWSLVGAIVGALSFLGLGFLMASRRRNKRRVRELKNEADEASSNAK